MFVVIHTGKYTPLGYLGTLSFPHHTDDVEHGGPSRTAGSAAVHRAAHQVLDEGRIFRDPLALTILGGAADVAVAEARQRPERTPMRIFIAVRHRVAEDALAAAVDRGTRQVVVLGAGLDTFAYRNRSTTRVFTSSRSITRPPRSGSGPPWTRTGSRSPAPSPTCPSTSRPTT
jgi:Leucine carboxyl methyltransferase